MDSYNTIFSFDISDVDLKSYLTFVRVIWKQVPNRSDLYLDLYKYNNDLL